MKTLILLLHDWVLAYFYTLNTVYFLLLASGLIYIYLRTRRIESGRMELFLQSEGLPSLGIVVPCYNEAKNIVFSVHSILNLHYSNKKVIIVNDGSSDESMNLLATTFQLHSVHHAYIDQIKTEKVLGYYHSSLYPNLIVIDKLNGGKADAINAGINACLTDYTLTIDADTIIDNFELSRMLRFIMTKPSVKGWGGSIRLANGCDVQMSGVTRVGFPHTYLGGSQVVEYLRAFYVGRMGWEPLGGALIISGAFSLFETALLKDLNGFSNQIPRYVLGEDMEVVVRLKKEGYRTHTSTATGFVAEPVCWTEVPETLKSLGIQRTRWHMAVFYSLWLHKSMFLNPKYGIVGLIYFPYYVFGELLSPLIECLGYVIILAHLFSGLSAVSYTLAFIAVTMGITALLNMSCCMVEVIFFRKYFSFPLIRKMLLFSLIENLGYRQLNIYWRLRSFWRLFRKRDDRKEMKKTGFASQ